MPRGLPAIFATRSGVRLGSKITFELSRYLQARNHMVIDNPLTTISQVERGRIERSKENNRYLFGNKSGHFCLRHIEIEDFSNEEVHVVVSNYRRDSHSKENSQDGLEHLVIKKGQKPGKEDQRVINSVRGQDIFLVHSPYEPRPELEDIVKGLGRRVRRNNEHEKAFDINEVEEIIRRVREERSPNDNLVEGWLVAYTLAKWAEHVTLLCPYMVGSRQDHSREREASTAKLIARIDEIVGVNHAIYTDLHSPQIAEFYDVTAENLRASSVLLPAIEKELIENGYQRVIYRKVVSSPDAGGAKKARYFAKRLDARVVIGDKQRNYTLDNTVDGVILVGEQAITKNAIVVGVDDMIDTGGSIERLVKAIDNKKPKAIYLMCTHAILSGPAIEILDKLYKNKKIKKLITTDSIPRPDDFTNKHPWYKEVSLAPMYAETIYNINMEQSVSRVYEETRAIKVVQFPNYDDFFMG